MTTPTPEQFLALPADPDEDDQGEYFTAELVDTGNPLESIADSLRRLVDQVEQHEESENAEDRLQQALNQLDAEYGELQEKVDQVLELAKKSTSKLANSIRVVLEPPVTVEVAEADPDPDYPEPHQPANDAPVEEWRDYARQRGFGRTGKAFDELEQMNRSQIRTMLGIPHGDETGEGGDR